ncbi:MAG: AEC family transporter [Treponema sp.]|nr:AEC family transporter [Treponema sp.]
MFTLLFATVASLLFYMILGFILVKTKKASINHVKTISGILVYVLGPAMIINSFLQLEFSWEGFAKIGIYFLISLLVQLIFFFLIFIFLRNKFTDSKYRILSIGSVLGNVGYLGMPVIGSIFPNEPIVLCYSSINVMTMNLIVFTIGTYMLTNDKKFISLKSAILNPTSLSLIVSIPLFILNIHLPKTMLNPIELLAKMSTPFCMIILGMRLAQSSIKQLFSRGFVYVTCLLKLIVFPILTFFLIKLIPYDDEILKTTIVVLAMAPSGAIIESLAELHDCQQDFAANVVLLTTILCVFTIPLMTVLLV